MALYIATESELTSVADAIRTKGGTSSPLVFPAGFVSAIEDIPTGGTTVEPKDVNFIDYDGTIVAAYTAEEFAALDALPENPTHEGLTAQGWNWTLSDAKTYVASYGKLWVGQMYITDDGKTRVYISLPSGAISPTLRLAVDGSAEVDWGDESTTDTLTGSSTSTVVTVNHTYAAPGDYCISIDVTGEAAIVGQNVMGNYYNGIFDGAQGYFFYIKKIEIGNNIAQIGAYAFEVCSSLSSVTIPDSVTSIGNYAFANCYALSSVTIPDNVTSIGNYAFQNCYALSSVTIPDSVTSIEYNAFQNCYALSSVTIPDNVTSIGHDAFSGCNILSSVTIPDSVTSIDAYAFSRCYYLSSLVIPGSVTSIGSRILVYSGAVKSITFKSTTPPTGSGYPTWYDGLPTTCIIYVPYSEDHSVLDAYKAASNYPSPSTYTYMEEPAS